MESIICSHSISFDRIITIGLQFVLVTSKKNTPKGQDKFLLTATAATAPMLQGKKGKRGMSLSFNRIRKKHMLKIYSFMRKS